jgi:hypothetical protein
MATYHEVQQGDCIFSIAFEYGFFPDTIWNHPNNAVLKKQRNDPGVLLPGDNVFVPDKRLKEAPRPTEQLHKFRCKNTPKKLRIQFLRLNKPIPNLNYILEIDGKGRKGKTDSAGWLVQSISPKAQRATVTLESGKKYDLQLGCADPVEEVTGIQGRLRILGYYEGDVEGTMDDETTESLKVFQKSNNLDVTGEADGTTKDLLKQLTGG